MSAQNKEIKESEEIDDEIDFDFYEDDIERDQDRVDQTGEVFTPADLVNEILDQLPEETWTDPNKTFLDPTCGDGNFLVELKRRLMEAGHSEQQVLSRIYGCDLMEDNVLRCIQRMYGPGEITEMDPYLDSNKCSVRRFTHSKFGEVRNIVCADGVDFDYNFNPDVTHPDTDFFAWSEE